MLTIGKAGGSTDYPVLLPSTAVFKDAIRTFEEQDRVPELIDYYEGRENGYHTWPMPFRIEAPRSHIGQLFWPVIGAARYAHAMYLMDGWQLANLRNDLGTDNAVLVKFSDKKDLDQVLEEDGTPATEEDGTPILEEENPIVFPMYMLAARPLIRTGARPAFSDPEPSIDDAWVVILVDIRFYWLNDTGVNQTDDWVPSSWTNLLTTLANNLYTAPPIAYTDGPNGSYSLPSSRWQAGKMAGRSTAHLLDAAAAAIGGRMLYTPSGGLEFQSPTNTNRNTLTDAHTALIDDDRHEGGGAIESTDITPGVPATAVVVAANDSTHTRASVSTGGGAAGRKVVAWLDCSAPAGTNASQWASDWYNWQIVPVDAMYVGACAVPRSGFLGHVLLWHDGTSCYTKYGIPPEGYSPLYISDDSGSGGTESFLAQLTAKCYYDGSGSRESDGFTPILGTEIMCAADLGCLTRFIQYSWVRVQDTAGSCPLSYSELPEHGSPQCFPAYHEGNVDLPVFPASSPRSAYAGSASDDSGAGTVTWTTPSQAEQSDDQYAQADMASGETTHYLKLEGFCFGLGGNDTITNIEVDVEGHASAASVKEVFAKLIVDGTITGNNLAGSTDFPLTDGFATYSASPTGWGVPGLTVKQVNDATFGFAFQVRNDNAGPQSVFVDSVQIKVSYTPAGFTAPRHSVVRLRKGAGDYYLIDQLPWQDLFRRTGDSDGDGDVAFHRYWDQNANDWRDGEEVRIVVAM